jgi:hypothetical protein
MQNEAAIEVMRSLKLPVDQAEVAKILADRTNDRLDSYKLLTESMGGGVEPEPTGKPHSAVHGRWWARLGPGTAEASENDEDAIRALLERYRAALESRDMARVESLHAALPTPMRDALLQYFQGAANLRVSSPSWTSWSRGTTRSPPSRVATTSSMPDGHARASRGSREQRAPRATAGGRSRAEEAFLSGPLSFRSARADAPGRAR